MLFVSQCLYTEWLPTSTWRQTLALAVFILWSLQVACDILHGVTSQAMLKSYFLTLRDKFRDKLLSVTAKRMLSSAGIEPRFPSIQQQVESTTPSWLLVFHLFKKVQVKNQQPRWCSGLNLLSYAWKPRFVPCSGKHSFRCCTKQLVSELVSQC